RAGRRRAGPRVPALRPPRAGLGRPRPAAPERAGTPAPPGLRCGVARRDRLLPGPPSLARPHVPPLQRDPVAGHVAADRGARRLLRTLLRGGGARARLARAAPRTEPRPPGGGAALDRGRVAPRLAYGGFPWGLVGFLPYLVLPVIQGAGPAGGFGVS